MASGSLIGNLAVNLSLETAAFQKGATYAQKQAANLQKKMQGIGDKLVVAGSKMTIGLTAPLAAFGISSFKAATDAAELQSSFDTTFGKMSGTMNKWAVATGNAMGRSTQEMQKAANTFGIFFNTAVDPAKAAAMSQTFSKLAQDLGSFYNVDTETAIEKLRSGLAGESEPLRAFGVFLTEAAVKAKAMELGLTGVGNALTEQEKIVARAALIYEQTAKAQGDVARTSEGTANQIRKSKAAFEELQVIVGTKLLPALTPLIEKLGAALTWFTNLPQPVQNVVLVMGALSAGLGPVLIVIGKLLPLVTALGPVFLALKTALIAARIAALAALPALVPFLVPLAALAAAVGAVYLAWKNWDKIGAIAERVYTAVKTWIVDKLNAVWDGLKTKIASVTNAFKDMYVAVVGNSYVPDMVGEIGQHMARLAGNMVNPAQDATMQTSDAFQALGDVAGEVMRGLSDGLLGVAQKAESFGQLLKRVLLGAALNFAKSKLGELFNNIPGALAGARANGGPVVGGSSYLIGERGREIFQPGVSGRIISNQDTEGLLSGRGGNTNINVYGVTDANSFNRSEGQIARAWRRRMATA